MAYRVQVHIVNEAVRIFTGGVTTEPTVSRNRGGCLACQREVGDHRWRGDRARHREI